MSDKGRGGRDENSNFAGDDDDDMIIKQESDEEEDGDSGVDAQVVETLSCLIPLIKQTILGTSLNPIHQQYDTRVQQPLGVDRIKSIELLYQIVRLNKPIILMALLETNLLPHLFELVKNHPWNNVLQLKIHSIFEELFGSNTTLSADKLKLVEDSKILDWMLELSD